MQTSSKSRIEAYQNLGWWDNETLHDIFDEVCQSVDPARLALMDPPNRESLAAGMPLRLTYADLPTCVDQIGSWLFASGLRQGDTVLVQLPNTVEIVLLYIAASKLGLIVSPIAMQYGQHEIGHISQTISPAAYIAFGAFRGDPFAKPQSQALQAGCNILTLGKDGFMLTKTSSPSPEYTAYAAGLKSDPNDILTVCWTSGTTGRSKGVPRSHNQWLASALAMTDAIGLPEGATFLNPFPFINMAAIGGFLYFWLKNKGTMALHHPFDPAVFLGQLQAEKAVYTIAPPALLNRLLETKEQIKAGFDLSHLKIIGSGSAPLSPHMIEGFKEHFDVDVINIFGSNEGAALLSSPREVAGLADRAVYFPRFGRPEHTWVNRVSKRIRTKLIDLETGGDITDPGQKGELCIMGATVFDGYYNSPSDNANIFTPDGYFRTGDLFEIGGDNNEFYRFVGRCKALIVRGGVNISPEELDELLTAHPDILEAAVASYPDKIMGEKICACVVPAEGKTVTLEAIKSYFADKNVAKFKWPERLRVMEALPRNPMNKVVRADLERLISTAS